MSLRERMAERAAKNGVREKIDKELKVKRESCLEVDGAAVCFCEYEDAPEGGFVKVCADDGEIGVIAEYVWVANAYPGASCLSQELTRIQLNGAKVWCDILTLQLCGGETRTIFFDISSFYGKLPISTLTITTRSGKTVAIRAEMARTEKQQENGFMQRTHIPDGEGMLFVMEWDDFLTFWMENTPAPLSIAYIDKLGVIRDIFDMTPFSRQLIESTVPVRYALEAAQGWFDRTGIAVGDRLTLDF